MKIYIHKETGSISREPQRDPDLGYTEEEILPGHTEYMMLRFDRFEVHRSAATMWFREIYEDTYGKEGSYVFSQRYLPMRIAEFSRLILLGHDPLFLEGWFSLSKRGSSVGIELR